MTWISIESNIHTKIGISIESRIDIKIGINIDTIYIDSGVYTTLWISIAIETRTKICTNIDNDTNNGNTNKSIQVNWKKKWACSKNTFFKNNRFYIYKGQFFFLNSEQNKRTGNAHPSTHYVQKVYKDSWYSVQWFKMSCTNKQTRRTDWRWVGQNH